MIYRVFGMKVTKKKCNYVKKKKNAIKSIKPSVDSDSRVDSCFFLLQCFIFLLDFLTTSVVDFCTVSSTICVLSTKVSFMLSHHYWSFYPTFPFCMDQYLAGYKAKMNIPRCQGIFNHLSTQVGHHEGA